jgi:NAD(P)H-hydrate epimerase
MGRAVPEAMSLTFLESPRGGLPLTAVPVILKRLALAARAIAVGPGLGRTAVTRQLVRRLVARATVPLVLDADALWALEGSPGLLRKAKAPLILTPHAGELKRLFGASGAGGLSARRSVAKRIANQYHCVLVMKGMRTIVAAPGKNEFVNTTGNPGLAKGGSGDVLTGIITGLAAQGFDAWTAARVGVFAHGRAADLAVKASSVTSLAASEILKFLPKVWSELEVKGDLAKFMQHL